MDGFFQADFELNQPTVEATFDVSHASCEAVFEINTAGNDKHYTHYQDSPSNVWEVEHNLEKYPSVSIATSAGDEVYADVEYIDRNKCILRFSYAFSGKAYFN